MVLGFQWLLIQIQLLGTFAAIVIALLDITGTGGLLEELFVVLLNETLALLLLVRLSGDVGLS